MLIIAIICVDGVKSSMFPCRSFVVVFVPYKVCHVFIRRISSPRHISVRSGIYVEYGRKQCKRFAESAVMHDLYATCTQF